MSLKWIKRELQNNVIEFSKGEERIYAPELIANRYEIESILSVSGGFGIIFTAKDTRLLGRKVLVKARRYDKEAGLFSYADDISRKEKIEQIRKQILFEFHCLLEFRRQGESRMPNVNDLVYDFSPALYGPHKDIDGRSFVIEDAGIVYQEPYIIMQMIDGQNLGDYIANGVDHVLKEREYDNFRLWEENVLQYGLQLCTIFNGFHKKDRNVGNQYFIYQDLKPENIMITYDTFLTLIDFGGMTVVKDQYGVPNSKWPNAGSPGLGTWGFKAPEMNEQEKMLSQLDQRVDVYGIGVTLYHLLTGDDPTGFQNEYGPIPIENLKQGKYQVTDATYELIRKATLSDREQRYMNVNEMRSQIREAFREVKKHIGF